MGRTLQTEGLACGEAKRQAQATAVLVSAARAASGLAKTMVCRAGVWEGCKQQREGLRDVCRQPGMPAKDSDCPVEYEPLARPEQSLQVTRWMVALVAGIKDELLRKELGRREENQWVQMTNLSIVTGGELSLLGRTLPAPCSTSSKAMCTCL